MSVVFQGCPKLLGHPQYDPRMNLGWEILPRDGHSSTPPCLSIPGFLRYSDDPGIIPEWTQLTPPPPCLSILGFLGYSDDPRIILGCRDGHSSTPPCLSIPGFLRYSDDPGIIPEWTQLTPPLSEYPGIPGILGRSQDHPGMDTALPPPCLSILGYSDDPRIIPGWMDTALPPPPPPSEYPGIPGILGLSWDHPGMDTALPPHCLSILGFLGYSDDPRIIPGWT